MPEVKEDPQRLFRFHWSCGRNGDLEGLFVAKQSEVDAAIGKKAYFGEVLGKHSEVQGVIEKGEIVLVEEADEKFAVTFGKIVGQTGWNPLEYIQCDECGQLQVDCGCKVFPASQ